jgi:DNA-binding Lrp family transcriptional regulator
MLKIGIYIPLCIRLTIWTYRILGQLQRDGTLSVDALSERVNLSRNACWRRVKQLWRSAG